MGPANGPMGGASEVPPQDNFGGAPNDGQNIGAGPGMEDPSMEGQPPMDGMGPEGGEPPMEEEPPMDAAPEEAPEEGGDDSTMSLFNQLSDEHKEAARGYIESMRKEENANEPDMGGEPPVDGEQGMGEEPMPEGPDGGTPVAEGKSFIFSKKQLKKLNENLPVTDIKKDDRITDKEKKGKNTPKKSPFNSKFR